MSQLDDQDIEVYRGEQCIFVYTFDPDENIVGQTFYFTVTKAANKTTKLIGPELMEILTPVATATLRVVLTEEMTDVAPGSYRWDVWRTDEGSEQVKAVGSFVVLGNSRVPPIE